MAEAGADAIADAAGIGSEVDQAKDIIEVLTGGAPTNNMHLSLLLLLLLFFRKIFG